MRVLPFDAHNHIHMGPTTPAKALLGRSSVVSDEVTPTALCGAALMSTHPRDYSRVLELSKQLSSQQPNDIRIIPCFGVHPWFLHQLSDADWESSSSSSGLPKWLSDLEDWVVSNPQAIVGEIGLDGHRYDPETKELTSPMDQQVEAFEKQMELAARLQRPVSIHSVQCWGQMMNVLSRLKKSKVGLPPAMYWHAFGGKLGTVDQILALCGREPGRTWFGFAPVINFRSNKTAEVIRKIGIDRLVLETDHEDAEFVSNSIEAGIRLLSEALGISEEEVVKRTTRNACDLYRIGSMVDLPTE